MEQLYSEIQRQLKLDLEEQLERCQDGSAIDWSFVRVNLGKLFQLRKYTDYFWDLFEFLMDCFDSYKIKDWFVIADVFQLAIFVSGYHQTSFNYAQTFVRFMRENTPRTKHCCYVYELMKMSFREKPSSDSYQLDVVWTAASYGHQNFVSRLLQYGMMYVPPNSITWNYCLGVLGLLLGLYLECCTLTADIHWPLEKDRVKPFFTIDQLSYHMKHWNSGYRRLTTIFRALEILGRSEGVPEGRLSYRRGRLPFQGAERGAFKIMAEYSTNSLEYIQCLKYIFDTIPEPFVTTQEIRTMFERIMRGAAFEAVVNNICCKFERYFPESMEPLAPRTLKHISRCNVRDIFRRAGNFPHGVEDLELPKYIVNYILLKE